MERIKKPTTCGLQTLYHAIININMVFDALNIKRILTFYGKEEMIMTRSKSYLIHSFPKKLHSVTRICKDFLNEIMINHKVTQNKFADNLYNALKAENLTKRKLSYSVVLYALSFIECLLREVEDAQLSLVANAFKTVITQLYKKENIVIRDEGEKTKALGYMAVYLKLLLERFHQDLLKDLEEEEEEAKLLIDIMTMLDRAIDYYILPNFITNDYEFKETNIEPNEEEEEEEEASTTLDPINGLALSAFSLQQSISTLDYLQLTDSERKDIDEIKSTLLPKLYQFCNNQLNHKNTRTHGLFSKIENLTMDNVTNTLFTLQNYIDGEEVTYDSSSLIKKSDIEAMTKEEIDQTHTMTFLIYTQYLLRDGLLSILKK